MTTCSGMLVWSFVTVCLLTCQTSGHGVIDEELRMTLVRKCSSITLERQCFDSKFSPTSMTVDCSKYREQIINNEELRIVLVGKTGTGKSASGNTILGRECFESKFSPKSMTVDCSKCTGTVEWQKVAVIDTPGLFDTRFDINKTAKDVSQGISYSAPGPHVFLVVIRLGRYTEEEMTTVQWIQELFGQAADKYSMVLFTHGDLLEDTIENFLADSSDLQELVARCNGQYHVFNNKNKDQSQVTELLQKIRDIVKRNGGNHYTNEMFQDAARLIKEKEDRERKEKEEQILKEREELLKTVREQQEEEMNKIREQFQAERERDRKEREEERKRVREEREEERRRERQEREAEMAREREERERERRQLEEQHAIQLRTQLESMQRRRRSNARREADYLNPLTILLMTIAGALV